MSVNQCAKPALKESAAGDQIVFTNFDHCIYRLAVFIEDNRCSMLKVLGGKMNEEGPDLFG